MWSISKIKMYLVTIEYKFFTYSKKGKEYCLSKIEELAFNATCEIAVNTSLKNKCLDNKEFLFLGLAVLEIINIIKSFLS